MRDGIIEHVAAENAHDPARDIATYSPDQPYTGATWAPAAGWRPGARYGRWRFNARQSGLPRLRVV